MVLNNLQPSTRYDIGFKARDLSNSSVNSLLSGQVTGAKLDTLPPSLVGSPSIVVTSTDQIRLTFTGSEYATSEVTCTSSRNGDSWTAGSETLKTRHEHYVKGLKVNTNYRCQITQIDVAGNKAVSNQYSIALGSAAPEEAPIKPRITRTDVEDGKLIFYVSTSDSGDSDLATYTVSCSDGDRVISVAASSSPITLSGLDSSKTYSCSATATNVNGFTSDASDTLSGLVPEELTYGLPVWLLYEAAREQAR